VGCNPVKLKEVLDEAGLSYRQNSVSYIFNCPKCLKSDKLYIRKRDGRFVCWFCKETDNYQGRPEFALADLMYRPIEEVRELLYGTQIVAAGERLDLQFTDFFGTGEDVDPDARIIPTRTFPYHYYQIDHVLAKRGRDYLAGRGISLEMAKEYHLRFSPIERRVIFPVELDDRLVGWQGRLVVDNRWWDEQESKWKETAKVLSSKDIPVAHTVMFANRLKGSRHAVVCEGPVDALKAHLCGGNIATMGKGVTKGQVEALRDPQRLTRLDVGLLQNTGVERIYLALDPDAARETARLVKEFSGLEVYTMVPPPGFKDLGEMTCEQVYESFLNAERVRTGRLFVYFKRFDY
jgi:hypothetical protein